MISRLATIGDVNALVSLHRTAFSAGWDAASFLDFIERDLVLVTGDPIIGFIIAREAVGEAEIITLVVDPLSQKDGKGLELLNKVINTLAQREIFLVFLEVASDNDTAIGLYLKAGFTQVGRRKAYYARASGPGCDALVMLKHSS